VARSRARLRQVEQGQQQADQAAAEEDQQAGVAARLRLDPGGIGAVDDLPVAAAELVEALARQQRLRLGRGAAVEDRDAPGDAVGLGEAGVLDDDAHAFAAQLAEELAQAFMGVDGEHDEAVEGLAPLRHRGGRRLRPIDRGAHDDARRAARVLHDLHGLRDLEMARVARQADGGGVARLRAGVEAEGGAVGRHRLDIIDHHVLRPFALGPDGEGRITVRVEAAVVAHAFDEGGLLGLADVALVGQGLQAGQALLQVEVLRIAVEFLSVHMAGADEQALQAENQVAEVVELLAELDEGDVGLGVEADLRLARLEVRRHPGGEEGNQDAARQHQPGDRARRQAAELRFAVLRGMSLHGRSL